MMMGERFKWLIEPATVTPDRQMPAIRRSVNSAMSLYQI
jgi:hypothetical protein